MLHLTRVLVLEETLPGIQAEDLNWYLSGAHRQTQGRWVFKDQHVGNRAERDALGAAAPVSRTGGGRISASHNPAGQPQGAEHQGGKY